MTAELLAVTLLNGVSYGLLLFMLSAGFTLIFSMMGVLNFAHASFYMLGAYVGYAISEHMGFDWALLVVPVLIGVLGAAFERWCLRKVHAHGHVAELLVTFGLSYLILEIVQLVWGRSAVPYRLPEGLQGPLFTWFGVQFPRSRAMVMAIALAMLVAIWLGLTRTRIGLIVQAALKHPQMAEALGHNVPRVFMGVFGGGCALAALAGVIGGSTYVTEPAMAQSIGSIIFVVVVVGGLGSLAGAFGASLLIGVLQTVAVTWPWSLGQLLGQLGWQGAPQTPWLAMPLAQVAPILPYALLVLMLVLRPRGLLGPREP